MTRASTRGCAAPTSVIRGDSAVCEPWPLPEVDGRIVTPANRDGGADLPSARRTDAMQRRAYEEGFALGRKEGRERGLEEGRAQARIEHRERVERLKALFDVLAAPLAELDAEVERAIVDLAMLVARHLVRRELKTDPGEVVAVVREAIAHLPVAARNPRIRLNPDDLELVREVLAPADGEGGWRLEADPLVTRGGCLVETETSLIDATVEARLAAIVARALGGERASDRGT